LKFFLLGKAGDAQSVNCLSTYKKGDRFEDIMYLFFFIIYWLQKKPFTD